MSLQFIHTAFTNASPLDWEITEDGTVLIDLLYDHERDAPNRAAGHWHLQVQAEPGTMLTLQFRNFDNIWNGRKGSPVSARTPCFCSLDGIEWSAVPCREFVDNTLKFEIPMYSSSLYLARLEPYGLGHLAALLDEIEDHPLVDVSPIGQTVEKRELEIIQVGNPHAPGRVLLRGRSHPWEPGGNWVIEGLIRTLLSGSGDAVRFLERYCVYCMPIANKDGVARGYTRFNVLGKDLNRDWGQTADPALAPENHALETWLEGMQNEGRLPHLAIDLHNDQSGKLHVDCPEEREDPYRTNMERFERLLRKHSWFTEGSTGRSFQNPGTFGEGVAPRLIVE